MCGCMNDKESSFEKKKSKKIDKQAEIKQQSNTIYRVLLLGAGESGKSTVVKQCKNLFLNGFTKRDISKMKIGIYSNILQSIQSLIWIHTELNLQLQNEDLKTYIEEITELTSLESFSQENYVKIKQLWEDPSFKMAYEKRSLYNCVDSAKHFLDRIDVIRKKDYEPNLDDLLMLRVRTTGISETRFSYAGSKFCMIDVGGQRNERKKWMHCFEDVTSVIFVASLSEYDQVLAEEMDTNRMKESLILFNDICNSRWFSNNSLILFLNKTDLLEKKIQTSPLDKLFPEYNGGSDFEQAKNFIKEKYLSLNKKTNKLLYSHFTCAIDSKMMKNIFVSVSDSILQNNISDLGLI
ncbi:guanine nucleotide-binding protein g(o) subunit alpha [Anaeramoeba flamelloides]|uniref:Guanine nucleotide-binding protein g(O) subunit alpha n=1 Tax=Anaeramoeba flamelloides TaxID=1746091 RepID=A0AAV7YRB3_9EUKA|nr:guanine nucleotide-binding protein g(o) subunit alpha [Anaeramoeba flamelloides]KAJ6230548.1 guanine nucleotide-binding protein g(o) subunit alpha [Anaeramoeba flamelloides]